MAIYVLLFFVAVCELSEKIDTTNIIKKIGIGVILVGGLVELYGTHNDLTIYGITIYFAAKILNAYFTKKKRRKEDK